MSQTMRWLRAARSPAASGVLAGIALLVSSTVVQAQLPSVYKVEEDWELVVNDPDPSINSPQITFFISPDPAEPGCYFQLQMNYAADDTYSSGGFHVGAFHHEQLRDEARSMTRRKLTADGDHVRWTNVMAAIDGELLFAVKGGQGNDWGSFGGPQYLVRISSDHISDLSQYAPEQSVDMVDIGFGANRVTSLVLKEARLYYTDGQVVELVVNASP